MSLEKVNENLTNNGGSLAQVRCPQCLKLFKIEKMDIQNGAAQFECVACHALFVVETVGTKLSTKALLMPQVAKLDKNAQMGMIETSDEFKTCPKCQTSNPRTVSECYKCGVVFAKIEQFKSDMVKTESLDMGFPSESLAGPGTLSTLSKMWHDLMHDYQNMRKHLEFVNSCEELHALPFALKKYQELKEVQPQDSLTQQMLKSVIVKSMTRQVEVIANHPKMKPVKDLPWANIFRVSPVVFSLLMIVIGILNPDSKNFAGVGSFLLVLILGGVWFFKGRVALEDFWNSEEEQSS